MDISLSPFAIQNLVSRDGFGRPVPRQPANLHTQAESGAHLRDPPEFRGGVCVFFLPIRSGHQVRWTYKPGSHRRKVTQDFSSTFLLRCVLYFFSREGFSYSFPSSTVKSNFMY